MLPYSAPTTSAKLATAPKAKPAAVSKASMDREAMESALSIMVHDAEAITHEITCYLDETLVPPVGAARALDLRYARPAMYCR
jgi:hypothetical protein